MFVTLLVVAVVAGGVYLQQPQFDSPQEPPAELAKKAVHSKFDGNQFENINPVHVMAEDTSQFQAFYRFLFEKDVDGVPSAPLPSMKTNLRQLPENENVVVWMGHSSIFMQLDGRTFLFDPVFSHYASPVPGINTAFPGSNRYTAADMPTIDYLLISHDHWDHLDYPTVHALQAKVRNVVVPLGVGSYFKQWGYSQNKIHELDWQSSWQGDALTIHALPAQHFSGRLLKKDQTLWTSYAVLTPVHSVFVSGDTGYGDQFKTYGEQYGPFDLAILENGQYDPAWPQIHMFPEQTAQAAVDLQAMTLMPEHNSKFKEAHHAWYAPMESLYKASEDQPYQLLTPEIGQAVDVDKASHEELKPWWRSAMPHQEQ